MPKMNFKKDRGTLHLTNNKILNERIPLNTKKEGSMTFDQLIQQIVKDQSKTK